VIQRKGHSNLSHLNFNWTKHSTRFVTRSPRIFSLRFIGNESSSPTKEEFGREK